ncbi:conserved Plasmodium protein, unknown function [Plasmodium ovale wallikeri]|uniref:Uncharacterized protein n=2 Tax=Plasmodium ovale TaxID=36330 RepID=A0A1A8YI94_PLAOA|nr:conserved Plasmodium protein, unknown function [Plasmodium ovale wallikeri]SBT31265.1 conserved Plasmodium protein, unknown function [Plasmodium ovale wallikeri]SBT75292.1 conserved Plasmodium protein, unknown function [Plasmodium ovale]
MKNIPLAKYAHNALATHLSKVFFRRKNTHFGKCFNALNSSRTNIENVNSELNHNDIDCNSKQIIEKYRDTLKARKEGHEGDKKKGGNFRPDMGNKRYALDGDKTRNADSISTDSISNICDNGCASSDNTRALKGVHEVVPGKDEKYVILKKQITKEFIHKVFLPHVESQIMHHLKTYTPDQIVNIFNIYSYLYYYDKKKEMVYQLLHYLEYRLDCFSVQNILLILEPLYILNKNENMYIYRLIINYIGKIKEKLNVYNYIGISRVYTKILIDLYFEEYNEKRFFLSDFFQYLRQRKFRKSIPHDQRNISHKDFLLQFMNEVIDIVESQLYLLSPIELTDLLSVISNYSYKNGYSSYHLPSDVHSCRDENDGAVHHRKVHRGTIPHDEAQWGTQPSEPTFRGEFLPIHNLSEKNAYIFKENVVHFIIIKEMINKYSEMSTLHKITNFYNLSKLCIYDEEFIRLIEKDINNYHYINNIHHKYLALLVWCMFKYKILHKHIVKLKPIIKQNIFNFNAKGFARLCHAIFNEKEILHKIANNLMSKIEHMSINEFMCYFYSVVCLDLLPFSGTLSPHSNDWKILQERGITRITDDEGEVIKQKHNEQNSPKELILLNKSEILQKCVNFIRENKKDIGKDEMTKIVLLLKKKKHEKYLYVLSMLPEEWKTLIPLIN